METLAQKTTLLHGTPKERVEKAIARLRNREGIILIDDENRENEGDLIFNAATMTVADMALLIRESSGIVCLCIEPEKAKNLDLPYMVPQNTSRYQTPFTVSVDAAQGISTGVSAADRIQTIQLVCDAQSTPSDLSRPGHVFPLVAHPNGVLAREGHTEGSIDLMKLSGLQPLAVLCELMNEDGSMRRLPELLSFAQKHDLAVVSIEDIVYYRTFVPNCV